MDSLITAAAHALAEDNPLGTLKGVSLRNDAPHWHCAALHLRSWVI